MARCYEPGGDLCEQPTLLNWAHKNVIAIRPFQIKAQTPVTISNGCWFKFKKRNPSVSLRSRDPTAEVRMNAVNLETLIIILICLKQCSKNMGMMSIQKPYTKWMKWVCLWNLVLPRLSQRRGKDSKISYVRTETENNDYNYRVW